ncbi:MAG: hypothetical protein KGL39_55370 [Patescibacteria group bacterium]|nr:hypothetical protein [Patescibacteria group bacterium]
MRIFRSVPAALNAGFALYERTSTGYLVRRIERRPDNLCAWALARVIVRTPKSTPR